MHVTDTRTPVQVELPVAATVRTTNSRALAAAPLCHASVLPTRKSAASASVPVALPQRASSHVPVFPRSAAFLTQLRLGGTQSAADPASTSVHVVDVTAPLAGAVPRFELRHLHGRYQPIVKYYPRRPDGTNTFPEVCRLFCSVRGLS